MRFRSSLLLLALLALVIPGRGEAQSGYYIATCIRDHGLLTGLSDDDHPQYGALAQNEAVVGSWKFSGLIYFGDGNAASDIPGTGGVIVIEGQTGGGAIDYAGTIDAANLTDIREWTFPDASGTVWTSGNDGTGSGLDADLLDGNDSSAFLTAEVDTLSSVCARGAQYTGGPTTFAQLQTGIEGADGELIIYAEQGVTDQTWSLRPNAAMTETVRMYGPSALPAATYLLTMTSGGVMGYDASTYLTAETDPQVGTLTNTKWCTTDGTDIDCTSDAPVLAEADAVIGNEVTNATDATLTRSGAGSAVDPYTLGINLGNANTWTAAQSVDTGSNGEGDPTTWATMVTGAALVNDTASTALAAYQDTPALTLEHHAWDTNDAQDDKHQWKIFSSGGGTTTTTSTLNFVAMKSPGGVDGASTARMTLTNAGAISATSSVTSTGGGFFRGASVSGTNAVQFGYSPTLSYGAYISWEGVTADGNEGEMLFPDVTGDRVITVPDESGVMQVNGLGTLTANDTTPDVRGYRIWTSVENAGATVITDLDNPIVGQIYILVIGHATNPPSIADGGNFALAGNWAPDTVGDNIVLFVAADNVYYEISRSNN